MKAFNENIGLQQDDKFSWVSSLHCLAKQLNLELDVCRIRNLKASTFKTSITRTINNASNSYWSRAITSSVGRSKEGSNKLRSDQSFKTLVQMEPYCIQGDREFRQIMATFSGAVIITSESRLGEGKIFPQMNVIVSFVLVATSKTNSIF